MSIPPRPHPATYWPRGSSRVTNDQLAQVLFDSASVHARRAVSLFTSQQDAELNLAAIGCGCAVEQLAKGFLAAINPLLVAAERPDLDTLLRLTGRGDLAKQGHSATGVQTISGAGALGLVKRYLPVLRYNASNDQMVFRVRNAALHLGLVDREELRRAVNIMMRIVEDLRESCALPREEFWGEHLIASIDTLLDDAVADVARVVAAKTAAASTYLANLLAGLDEVQQRALLAAVSGRQLAWGEHDEERPCPVCAQTGWLTCGVERGQIEIEWEHDGDGGTALVSTAARTAWPDGFDCSTCRLHLEGSDELRMFGMDDEIELEPDFDTDEGYEPDEDDYRDR